jgi:hypothetical protein
VLPNKKTEKPLKGNECAAYFLKTTKQQRAAECHLPIPNLLSKKEASVN